MIAAVPAAAFAVYAIVPAAKPGVSAATGTVNVKPALVTVVGGESGGGEDPGASTPSVSTATVDVVVGSLEGASVELTVAETVFADPVSAADFAITGSAGVNVVSVDRLSETEVRLTFSSRRLFRCSCLPLPTRFRWRDRNCGAGSIP